MSGVRLGATAMVRRGWVGIVAVALLVGLGGGAVLAAVAGARRTSSAATRLYARGRVADVEIDPTEASVVRPGDVERLRRLPDVTRATTAQFFAGGEVHGTRPPSNLEAFVAANADGTWIYDFDRVGLLPSFRGRMPDPARPDEVIATAQEARLLHVRVGSTIRVAFAKFSNTKTPNPTSFAPPITLHVVGVATTPLGLLRNGKNSETFLFGTPAFARRYADRSLGATIYVQLRDHHDLPAFERRAPDALGGQTFDFQPAQQELATFSRVARPFTSTLWLFAVVAALSTVLIVAQALVRMVRGDAGEAPELAALGLTRRQRAAVAGTRAGIAALGGAVVAMAIAVIASPLFPLGLVHRVEPDPGVLLDAPVIALGGLAVLAVLGLVVVGAAWTAARTRVSRGSARVSRPARLATVLARAGAPVSVVQGAQLAFRRSRRGVTTSTATSVFGLVAALTAISAALVFGANLRGLTTPTRYGQTWDAEVESSGPVSIVPAQVHRLLTRGAVASGLTFGTFGDLRVEHEIVPAYGFRTDLGDTLPVAQRGRVPRGVDEVAFGSRTLRRLHRSVGDTVTATAIGGATERLRIVGETLLPSLNPNTPALGADDGAELTAAGLDRLDPGLRQEIDFVLVRFGSHGSMPALRAAFGSDVEAFTITGTAPPGDIASYGDVQSTPFVLAFLLTILGVGVLAHLLITSVRTNRRELAVLKAIGCRRRQLLAIVITQALLLAIVALAFGLAIGVALGRGAWTRFVAGLGLPALTRVPIGQLTGLVALTFASAGLIACLPARAATRVVPARVLRTE